MKNESAWNAIFVKALRARYPEAVVWKINDAITGGIPDVVITWPDRQVLWIEVKRKGKEPTPLQAESLRRLGRSGTWIEVDLPTRSIISIDGLTLGPMTIEGFCRNYVDSRRAGRKNLFPSPTNDV